MKAVVYHSNCALFGFGKDTISSWPKGYKRVAEIENCSSLGQAFELTNHIMDDWWNNPGVVRIGPPCRSTSVGDVVVFDDEAFLCDPIGWTSLGKVQDFGDFIREMRSGSSSNSNSR